jgi:hypothetical protein
VPRYVRAEPGGTMHYCVVCAPYIEVTQAENMDTADAPVGDVQMLLQPFLTVASAPTEPLAQPCVPLTGYTTMGPDLTLYELWPLLDAAAEDERAQQLCKNLKGNRSLKNNALEILQEGPLIWWLNDHPEMRDQLIRRYALPLDAKAHTKGVRQGSSRVLITRDWFQHIASVIGEDQEADTKACAAPDRAEIFLDRARTLEQWQREQWPPDVVEAMASLRTMVIIPSARKEIYLSENPKLLPLDDLRGRPVLLFPLKTNASWERARLASQIIQTVAATVRIIPSWNPNPNDLAACELWRFGLCQCQLCHQWTIGDEHFQNFFKMCQKASQLEEFAILKARD